MGMIEFKIGIGFSNKFNTLVREIASEIRLKFEQLDNHTRCIDYDKLDQLLIYHLDLSHPLVIRYGKLSVQNGLAKGKALINSIPYRAIGIIDIIGNEIKLSISEKEWLTKQIEEAYIRLFRFAKAYFKANHSIVKDQKEERYKS